MSDSLPFYEGFSEFERDGGLSSLLVAADAASFTVCGVGVKTAETVGMSACHGNGSHHQFEADGALKAAGSDDLSELGAAGPFSEG